MEGTDAQALAVGQVVLDYAGANMQTAERDGTLELWVKHGPKLPTKLFSIDKDGTVKHEGKAISR